MSELRSVIPFGGSAVPFTRSLSVAYVNAIKESSVWKNLILDADLQPEIRVGEITVYYRGGALIKSLKVNAAGRLKADVHRKFIPISRQRQSEYLRLEGDSNTGLQFVGQVDPIPIGLASRHVLTAYKAAMNQVLRDFPEGHLVHNIATRIDNVIVDQELTFEEPDVPRVKVDLCYFDLKLKKLVFVEVKRVVDGRLFAPDGRPEVLNQLQAYCERMEVKRDEILRALQTVVALKRSLGLGERLEGIPNGEPLSLLGKPLLVIGNCSKEERASILRGHGIWAPLMAGLGKVASGLVICGSDGCKLQIGGAGHSISFL